MNSFNYSKLNLIVFLTIFILCFQLVKNALSELPASITNENNNEENKIIVKRSHRTSLGNHTRHIDGRPNSTTVERAGTGPEGFGKK
uniref:CLAVATA3/ESR-like protein n=1 Tax=Strongyloides papillosus TaxID=174720 RepID=A0A0N5BEH6_STREA